MCGAGLNEELVKLLLVRDELHMEQDAMLVNIEDLTRYTHTPDQAHTHLTSHTHTHLTRHTHRDSGLFV